MTSTSVLVIWCRRGDLNPCQWPAEAYHRVPSVQVRTGFLADSSLVLTAQNHPVSGSFADILMTSDSLSEVG